MLTLLRNIQTISASKDSSEILSIFIRAVFDFSKAYDVILYKLINRTNFEAIEMAKINAGGLTLASEDDPLEEISIFLPSYIVNKAIYTTEAVDFICSETGLTCYIFPCDLSSNTHEKFILIVRLPTLATLEKLKALHSFYNIVLNHLSILDYSQSDTLTGLLNRKTFDETFDRILTNQIRITPPELHTPERRSEIEHLKNNYWLAVMDIDHFKRVNDTFGHLFGDEVLIRFANLMRQTLRSYDKLFRFGGEEFVVMLRIETMSKAIKILNRLRESVAQHEFPQVGKVTCSIGLTQVNSLLVSADILDKADKALYYAKENGRNLVCCCEDLVEQGLLEETGSPTNNSELVQADIDALFD